MLKPGWLQKQFKLAEAEIKTWPTWMQPDQFKKERKPLMPTTLSEMGKIREIILQHIDVDKARDLASKLYEQVGRHTKNQSLSVTLAMLVGAFEE